MSAYPEGFPDWPLDRRNAFFAQEAKDYSARKATGAIFEDGRHVGARRADKRRFPLIPFGSIRPDEGANYLIKGLFPRAGMAVVWGPPKCGKSFWVFDALMHVALNWEYRGHRVTPGPVVYGAFEGAHGFRNRVEAFRLRKLAEAASDPPFYLMATPLRLVTDHAALIASIREQVPDGKPFAVCLDTLNRSLEGSESSDADMSAYIRAADAIRDAFGCLVVIVHHCGHNGERPRGHSALIGALDVQIAVRKDAAGHVFAEVELFKDGEAGLQFASHLVQVEIGVDGDGDPVTSCIVEATEGVAPEKARKLPPKAAQTALRALQKAIEEVGELAPPSNTIPSSGRVVTVETWRRYAYASGISDSDDSDAKRQAFGRAYKALTNGNHVGAWNEWRWIIP